jgi:hypothetical protein
MSDISKCKERYLAFAYRVVEAWAMILPPIGFLGSAVNIAAPPST